MEYSTSWLDATWWWVWSTTSSCMEGLACLWLICGSEVRDVAAFGRPQQARLEKLATLPCHASSTWSQHARQNRPPNLKVPSALAAGAACRTSILLYRRVAVDTTSIVLTGRVDHSVGYSRSMMAGTCHIILARVAFRLTLIFFCRSLYAPVCIVCECARSAVLARARTVGASAPSAARQWLLLREQSSFRAGLTSCWILSGGTTWPTTQSVSSCPVSPEPSPRKELSCNPTA